MKHSKSNGFTIVELIIATSVFSVILLLSTAGVLYVGRLFYKGTTSNLVQEVARTAIDELKADFELSGGFYTVTGDTNGSKGFCIGNHLYSYRINNKISNDGNGHALVVDDLANCDTLATVNAQDVTAAPTGRELLGPNMRLARLDIVPTLQNGKAQSISIRMTIVAGDDDLVETDIANSRYGLCKGGAGSQFCASSDLSTYANRRLRQ